MPGAPRVPSLNSDKVGAEAQVPSGTPRQHRLWAPSRAGLVAAGVSWSDEPTLTRIRNQNSTEHRGRGVTSGGRSARAMDGIGSAAAAAAAARLISWSRSIPNSDIRVSMTSTVLLEWLPTGPARPPWCWVKTNPVFRIDDRAYAGGPAARAARHRDAGRAAKAGGCRSTGHRRALTEIHDVKQSAGRAHRFRRTVAIGAPCPP